MTAPGSARGAGAVLGRLQPFLIGVLLAAAIVAVYGRVVVFDFVNVDDPGYVQDNEHVRAGWTRGSVLWASSSMRLDPLNAPARELLARLKAK